MKKLIVLSLLMAFVFSCQPPVMLDQPDLLGADDPAARFSPVRGSGHYGPFFDESGKITTSIHWAYAYGDNLSIQATVDADEVLIGGGAYVSNGSKGLLTASYPWLNKYTASGIQYGNSWIAGSKSHIVVGNHYLYVYAIGIKFEGMGINKELALEQFVRYSWTNSEYADHPTATAYPPDGFTTVGGGARVMQSVAGKTIPGNFLTGSYGVMDGDAGDFNGWRGSAKDHVISSPTWISVYNISLKNRDHTPGSGWNCQLYILDERSQTPPCTAETRALWKPITTTAAYTKGNAGMDNHYGLGQFVVIGAGGLTEYNDVGRILTGISFKTDGSGVQIYDTESVYPDSGVLHAQMILIRLDTPESQGCLPGT